MAHSHIILPYQSISEDDKVYEFGMSPQQVAAVDKRVFEIKEDINSQWVLERRSGYSTEFVGGKLAAVAFNISPNHNRFEVSGVDISDKDGIEQLKREYEHLVFADRESVLFPTLGFAVHIHPFCDGWSDPRPGVFNREIVAFSRERLEYYRNQAHVVSLQSGKGVCISGDKYIQFAMTPAEIHNILGTPEYTWKNSGSHKHIVEYYFNRALTLRYRDYEVSYDYREDMPLYAVEIMEKDGWEIEVDGVYLFADDKLEQMKSKYEYIESKKKKAVDFTKLGIFTLGCGEKKNNGKGADGKVVFLYNRKVMDSYAYKIDMWD